MKLSNLKKLLAIGATVMAISGTAFAATPANTTNPAPAPTTTNGAATAQQVQAPVLVNGGRMLIDRSSHKGVIILPDNRTIVIPANNVPSPSTNLVKNISGYNVYMDIPAWVSSNHTNDKVVNNGPNVNNFTYNTNLQGLNLQITVAKDYFPAEVVTKLREDINKGMPPVGTKLKNMTITKEMRDKALDNFVNTKLEAAFIQKYLYNFSPKYLGAKIFLSNIDKNEYIIANMLSRPVDNKLFFSNNLSIYSMEGRDLIIVSYGYYKNLTPEEQNTLTSSLVSLRIEKAK